MSREKAGEFAERRDEGNRAVLREGNILLKRFFALDHDAYSDGALSRKAKELQGLVASTVLRCDDCISYHLAQAKACGASRVEVVESLAVALVAGGSIVIPHLRRAFARLDELWGNGCPGDGVGKGEGKRA